MTILRLLAKEILHRKLNFALALLAVAAASALFVSLLTMGLASQRETRRLMREMGFNLLIVPKDTNMEEFWAKDFADREMPEEYVRRVAAAGDISAEHYVAMLQKKVEWRGRSVILTGVLPELGAIGKLKKAPMGFAIERGAAYVGFEPARGAGLERGGKIEVLGREFAIERCLPESGSVDDIRIYVHLHDAQEVLDRKGRINTIQALGCQCAGDRLATIREQLSKVLPDTKVTELKTIAVARAETQKMIEGYAAVIAPLVLLICAAWVGLLSLSNVRDRRQEIGVLRALGAGSWPIAALFLGKAVVLGLIGALLGFAIGSAFAIRFGQAIFPITSATIQPLYWLLPWVLVAAPAVAALASALPAMAAVAQDPAETLAQE